MFIGYLLFKLVGLMFWMTVFMMVTPVWFVACGVQAARGKRQPRYPLRLRHFRI